MHFSIYQPDGSIYQSNKVWHVDDATRTFENGLRDLGQKFVKTPDVHLLPPDEYFVDVKVEEILKRPIMPVELSKTHFRVGTDDAVLITGIPPEAKYKIFAGTTEYISGEMDSDGTEIQFSAPVPSTYSIVLDKWPYRSFRAQIEGHP